MGNLKKKYAQGFLPEKLPQQDHTTTTDSEMEEPYLQGSVPRPWMLGLRAGWNRTSARLEGPFLVSTEGLRARKCVNMSIDQTFPPSCTQPRPWEADRSSCPRGNVCPLPLQPRDPRELLLSCRPAGAAPGELPPSFSASGACTQERGQCSGTVKPVRAALATEVPG